MSAKDLNLEKLIGWLGSNGAIAGLEGSDMSISELNELAVRHGLTARKGWKRREIIVDLVNGKSTRIDKTKDELMAMTHEDLASYFRKREISRTEMLGLLDELDIRPGIDAKKDLVDFAAREISDLGMFRRVARGRKSA